MIWITLALALVVRIINLNQSLWLDEAINVLAARDNSLLALVTEYAVADFHPPGYFVILWGWGQVFGFSEISVRIPSVIFGVATIYLVYIIGRKIVSQNLGLLAALLLAVNPLHVYYSQEARMYSFAAFVAALNMLFFWKLFKEDKGYWGYGISAVLALGSDYLVSLIFLAQLAILLIQRDKKMIKKWSMALIPAMIAGLIWLPVFIKQLGEGLWTASQIPSWKEVVGGFGFKSLILTYVKFIIGRISYPDKIIYASLFTPAGLLFVYLLYSGIKKATAEVKKLLLIWIFLPLFSAWLISIFVPVFSYFRMLFVIPAFTLLISLGLFRMTKKVRYVLLSAVSIVYLFSLSIYFLNPVYQREDWKNLMQFLKNEMNITNTVSNASVIVESTGLLAPFEYYAQGEIYELGALKNIPAKNESDLVDLDEQLYGVNKVFLLDYLVDITDPGREVRKKLLKMGFSEKNIYNFNGVGFVYLFSKENN